MRTGDWWGRAAEVGQVCEESGYSSVGSLGGRSSRNDRRNGRRPTRDCYNGIWTSNEELTKRTRPVMGPIVLMFAPWGDNGWVRLNIGDLQSENTEYHFLKWDGRIYQVYGNDPREQMIRKIDDYNFETISVREGRLADKSFLVFSPRQVALRRVNERTFEVIFIKNGRPAAQGNKMVMVFSEDRKRLTATAAAGVTMGGTRFTNDVRIYDRIDPNNWPSRAP